AMMLMALRPSYSLLVQLDPKEPEKVIPDVAERWEVSPDGKTYTFYLHKGVKFHDGTPATSADVKVSFDRIARPPKGIRSPRSGYFLALERIETPDERTVKFHLKYPQASFLAMVASPFNWIYPEHILKEKGDMTKDVVGTGPFKLKEYSRGVSWKLVKNPDYFVPGRPYLDGIDRYIIGDNSAILAALRTHRIQLTTPMNNYSTPAERRILGREAPEIIAQGVLLVAPRWVVFNYKREPFSDIRIRRAVNLAFDHQAAVRVLEQGDGEVGAHFMAGSGWEIPQEELLRMPGYRQPKDADIAEAKRLLSEAGYPGGFKTSILTWSQPEHINRAVFLRGELSKIGIDATLDLREVGAFYSNALLHNFSLIAFATGYPLGDPDAIISELYLKGSGSNYGDYENPKLEELYVKQSQTMDHVQRKKLLQEIQNIFLEDVPNIISHWPKYYAFWWPEVRGWAP
ncbi:MAG: ABC transporter substrate-binding protein, partial [Chloroflexota bacterium]|nr:ABC transporter substrate-binding protein [Chloroflexota bacterium]